MAERKKVLIVEDETPIRKLFRAGLNDQEFELIEAQSAKEGLQHIAGYNPELIILDLGLPDMDGVQLIKELRSWSDIPVIVLSARGEETTKVAALDAGANDYVTKPFSMPELLARIRVAVRLRAASKTEAPPIFESGPIRIDFAAHEVSKNGERVHLTPLEFKLLTILARNTGRVLTHKQLLSEVWGPAYLGQNHYLRIFMKALRHKLEDDPARPRILVTESGVGYRLLTE